MKLILRFPATCQVRACTLGLPANLPDPAGLRDLPGLPLTTFAETLPHLITNAELDTDIVTRPCQPDADQLRRLFEYAYEGKRVDF